LSVRVYVCIWHHSITQRVVDSFRRDKRDPTNFRQWSGS